MPEQIVPGSFSSAHKITGSRYDKNLATQLHPHSQTASYDDLEY
jgi:hypothetical protein